MIPKYVIVGLESEIPAFEQVVCGMNMPTVDMAACLQQIFEVMALAEVDREDRAFNKMLVSMAEWMGRGEGLYENARLDENEKDQIIHAIIKIGNEIKKKIKFYRANIDGFFPYTFHKLAGKNVVVLVLIDPEYLS
jgi:hypothetical protein